ncbi:hypothetical protein Droror1_Dr00021150 [Drosera rotundifolia]
MLLYSSVTAPIDDQPTNEDQMKGILQHNIFTAATHPRLCSLTFPSSIPKINPTRISTTINFNPNHKGPFNWASFKCTATMASFKPEQARVPPAVQLPPSPITQACFIGLQYSFVVRSILKKIRKQLRRPCDIKREYSRDERLQGCLACHYTDLCHPACGSGIGWPQHDT